MNRRLDDIAGLTIIYRTFKGRNNNIIVILGETNKNFAEKYVEYGGKTIEELTTEMMANLTPAIRAEFNELPEPGSRPQDFSNGGRPNRRQKRSSNRKQNRKSNKQNRKSNKNKQK